MCSIIILTADYFDNDSNAQMTEVIEATETWLLYARDLEI
jgi:hypothetical protein